MTTVIIRNLDARVIAAFQRRATFHGRSLEAEIRAILSESVAESPGCATQGLGTRIHESFAVSGGFDLPDRPTEEARAADFS